MSRIGGYLIVAGIAASRLEGQEVEQMARRLDSAWQQAQIATEAVVAYRRAHPLRFDFSDSIIAGGGKVKVFFNAPFAEKVRAGMAESERHLSEMGHALDGMKPMFFSVVPESAFNSYDKQLGRVTSMNVRQYDPANPNNPSRNWVEGDPKSIADVILRAVSGAVSPYTPSHIASFVQGTVPVAPDLEPKPDWGVTRLRLVSSASYHGRACFLGNLKSCRLVLGLDRVADPIHQLYDTTGRRLVVQYEGDRSRRASAVGTERCLAGSDEACEAVLNVMGGQSVTVLSSPFVRSEFVVHALRLGGPKAAERLLTTPGTPGDAIAAAAKQPLDSVVASWQRQLNQRSVGGNLPLAIILSSIAWIALCVFLALRSSRWR